MLVRPGIVLPLLALSVVAAAGCKRKGTLEVAPDTGATSAFVPDSGSAAGASADAGVDAAPSTGGPTTAGGTKDAGAAAHSGGSSLPKPCEDKRLGTVTFTDVGGGKVKIATTNKNHADCARTTDAKILNCDWVDETGKPKGRHIAHIDPKNQIGGTFDGNHLWSCKTPQ